MANSKISLVLGIIIGIVLAFFYFQFFAPRYEIQKTAAYTMKIDKWSGQSWRMVDNNWKKMAHMDEAWEEIDKTLQKALKIPFVQVDTNSALIKLRENYPILNEISDEDLLERIKLVYSKMVMVNMYLGDFMKADKGEKSEAEGEISAE